MSSANLSEPFTFSTLSLEFLETVVGLLKNSLPSDDENLISILKKTCPFTGSLYVTKDALKA